MKKGYPKAKQTKTTIYIKPKINTTSLKPNNFLQNQKKKTPNGEFSRSIINKRHWVLPSPIGTHRKNSHRFSLARNNPIQIGDQKHRRDYF